jgi:hypothetical protein
MSDTWAWISGWAICPKRFKSAVEGALPDDNHVVFAPTPGALNAALQVGASRLGGYSLGSLLLLSELDRVPEDVSIYCFAPFTAFCAEQGMGGTTPVTALEMIQARLVQQPEKALKLFYRLAGLKEASSDSLPYAHEDLVWGLEALKTICASTLDLNRVTAIFGVKDPLLDSDLLASKWHASIRADCQHDYRDLLQAFVKTER